MIIHKTQNLSTLVNYQPDNSVSSEEFRLKNYQKFKYSDVADDCFKSYVTFGKKKPSAKDIEKLIKKSVRKNKNVSVGNIEEKAKSEVKKGDRILNSKTFDKMLALAENEPVIQAAMGALICIGLRPITIMAIPSKKGKDDNMYASAHSISSGIMGLVSAIIIAQPFKAGSNYLMQNMLKDLDIEALERLYPHLNLKSIVDSKGMRKPVEEWLDKSGNKFSRGFKDVDKIPAFKMFNEISAESFKKFTNGADIDWAAQKGKTFNEVVTKDGKLLYDIIDWSKVGIIVERTKIKDANVLIKDMDKTFFKEIIADAEEGSAWKNLDIDSVFKDNKVVDFRKWKDKDGKQWKLDLGSSYISSVYDTADYIPRITGKLRFDKKNNELKDVTYMKNGKDGELGTEITQDLVDIGARNEVHDKILTWLPDIITRPLVASATIALIPLALQHVFHLEKPKKTNNQLQNQEIKTDSAEASNKTEVSFKGRKLNSDNSSNISFNGKGTGNSSSKFKQLLEKLFIKPLAKIYAKTLLESKLVSNVAKQLSTLPGEMSTHMATLGSLLTSSVYMQRTLNNKDLDSDRRRTLAINQGLCFIIPTICAYTVNKLLNNWTKQKEYRYSGLREQEIAIAKLQNKNPEYIKSLQESLGKKLSGVRVLAGLATFTLIYRYITPVLITPFANSIGDRINARNKAKEAYKKDTGEHLSAQKV